MNKPARFDPNPFGKVRRTQTVIAVACAVPIGFYVWIVVSDLIPESEASVRYSVLFILGTAYFLLVGNIRKRPEPELPMETDSRPPLLFCRSHTESALKTGPRYYSFDGSGHPGSLLCLDLEAALWDRGRTILLLDEFDNRDAINTSAPFIIKTSDAEWKLTFALVAEAAQAIIFSLATSEGTLTEIATAMENEALRAKSLIFMPPAVNVPPFESDYFSPWADLKQALRLRGYSIPDYHPQGMLYLPNRDLSIAKAVMLAGSMNKKRLVEAFDTLLPNLHRFGKPLSEIASALRPVLRNR